MALRRQDSKTPPKSFGRRLYRSVWLFPIALAVVLILLTAFKISGTSVGMYWPALFGNTKNPNLLLNEPRGIRSDEWIVTTQLAIAQDKAGYPRVNHNLGTGIDMSLIGDAPYKEWSAVFKPQNFSFFVMPFENAFAFKWWVLLYALVASCYFFTLRLFKNRRLFAAVFSLAIGLSPFVFWWYISSTLATLAYGFLIMLVGIRIIDSEPVRGLARRPLIYSNLIYVLALTYLLTAFALVLYPPFQIPVAIVIAAFLAGYYLNQFGLGRKLVSRTSLMGAGVFLASLILAGVLILTFINTRKDAISTITHTVYPSKREVTGGGLPVYQIFNTYLQPQLQREARAIHYYNNQSEASNFILFLPFLLLPGFAVLWAEHRQTRRLNWALLAIQLCSMLFLLHLFVGSLGPFYKLFGLNKVPHARLFIGIGLAGVVQLLLILNSLERLKIRARNLYLLAGSYALVCLTVLAWAGHYTRAHFPQFINSVPFIGFLALFFATILFLFLIRRATVAAVLLLLFSAGCVFHIHPVYRGVGPLYNNRLYQAIDKVSKPGDSWATLDSIYYENFGALANRDDVSGIRPYPDLSFWRQVEGPKADDIYNRYAHIWFSGNPDLTDNLKLVQADNFVVKFACTNFVEKNVDFAVASYPLSAPCVKEVSTISYPAVTFHLYKVD